MGTHEQCVLERNVNIWAHRSMVLGEEGRCVNICTHMTNVCVREEGKGEQGREEVGECTGKHEHCICVNFQESGSGNQT